LVLVAVVEVLVELLDCTVLGVVVVLLFVAFFGADIESRWVGWVYIGSKRVFYVATRQKHTLGFLEPYLKGLPLCKLPKNFFKKKIRKIE
tara:strand:+ start:220 stop:489 length:270 start_codon:yes stop_codon:yes gene_type:complete